MSKVAIAFFTALFLMTATDAYAESCEFPIDQFIKVAQESNYVLDRRIPSSSPEFGMITENLTNAFGEPKWKAEEYLVWHNTKTDAALFLSAVANGCSQGYVIIPKAAISTIFGEQI
jgi:hypothetical protein